MPDENSPQEVRKTLLERFNQATSTGTAAPLVVSAHSILKNLDNQFVFQYLRSLEGAKKVLNSYVEELDGMNKRLAKADPAVRLALGQDEIDAKKVAIQETLHKLEVHQRATQKRLMNG